MREASQVTPMSGCANCLLVATGRKASLDNTYRSQAIILSSVTLNKLLSLVVLKSLSTQQISSEIKSENGASGEHYH